MARDFARQFYKSKEWQLAREGIRLRAKGLCEKCGAPGEEVHHIIHLSPDNIWDTSITLNPDNLIMLCRDCHQRIHNRDKANGHIKDKSKVKLIDELESKYIFDDNGMLVKRQ